MITKRDLLRLIEQERKQHRAELTNLLDRLANAQQQPWTLPPRTPEPLDEAQLAEEAERANYEPV